MHTDESIFFFYVAWAKALARLIDLGQSHMDAKPENAKWLPTKKTWKIFATRATSVTVNFNKELKTQVISTLDATIKQATAAIAAKPLEKIGPIISKDAVTSSTEATDKLQALIKTPEFTNILIENSNIMMLFRIATLASSISKAICISYLHRNL